MGFYGPAQLVADARRHAVEVRPVDVTRSDWDCTLEDIGAGASRPADDSVKEERGNGSGRGGPAVRLGLRLVSGLPRASVERLLQARAEAPFADVPDLALRAGLEPHELQTLAEADALAALAGHRRQQVWAAAAPLAGPRERPPQGQAGERTPTSLLRSAPVQEAQLSLIEAPEGEAVTLDYAATGLSLRRHPLALLRERLQRQSVRSAAELSRVPDGRTVRTCGLVVTRQQPATAKGTIFVTLEDETGPVNVIVWRDVRERHRQALLGARLLAVRGTWQRRDGVSHLIAQDLHDMSAWLGRLQTQSRDFH
jgi:error-prone DNA polymerase